MVWPNTGILCPLNFSFISFVVVFGFLIIIYIIHIFFFYNLQPRSKRVFYCRVDRGTRNCLKIFFNSLFFLNLLKLSSHLAVVDVKCSKQQHRDSCPPYLHGTSDSDWRSHLDPDVLMVKFMFFIKSYHHFCSSLYIYFIIFQKHMWDFLFVENIKIK